MSIEVSRDRSVTILRLSKSDRLNVIDTSMGERLVELLEEAAQDDSLALVLTGEGRAFCAGSDLQEQDMDGMHKVGTMHRVAMLLVNHPKLTVAAINGMALGGGLELALGCALRVAAPAARMGLPEIKLAAIPCYGGTQLLPRLIGTSRALSMMLTGDPVTADEALSMGLITAIDEDPVERAITLALQCAEGRQVAQRSIRRAVWQGLTQDLEEGLALERTLALEIGHSPELREGLAQFLARSRAD